MGKGTGKLVARAIERVEARHWFTRPGVQVPFDVFVREVSAEVCVLLERRADKNLRKIARAAERLCEAEAERAGLALLSARAAGHESADLDPAWLAVALAEGSLPPEREGEPGPPRWHPEHRRNDLGRPS